MKATATMAKVTVTVEMPGVTITETYGQADPQHAIMPLGDDDGWKWAESHFGRRARQRAETTVGWALRQAYRAVQQRQAVA